MRSETQRVPSWHQTGPSTQQEAHSMKRRRSRNSMFEFPNSPSWKYYYLTVQAWGLCQFGLSIIWDSLKILFNYCLIILVFACQEKKKSMFFTHKKGILNAGWAVGMHSVMSNEGKGSRHYVGWAVGGEGCTGQNHGLSAPPPGMFFIICFSYFLMSA